MVKDSSNAPDEESDAGQTAGIAMLKVGLQSIQWVSKAFVTQSFGSSCWQDVLSMPCRSESPKAVATQSSTEKCFLSRTSNER